MEMAAKKAEEQRIREEKDANRRLAAENNAKATLFYQTLLRRRVVRALSKNRSKSREVQREVENKIQLRQVAPLFARWAALMRANREDRIRKADRLRSTHLLKK